MTISDQILFLSLSLIIPFKTYYIPFRLPSDRNEWHLLAFGQKTYVIHVLISKVYSYHSNEKNLSCMLTICMSIYCGMISFWNTSRYYYDLWWIQLNSKLMSVILFLISPVISCSTSQSSMEVCFSVIPVCYNNIIRMYYQWQLIRRISIYNAWHYPSWNTFNSISCQQFV